MIYIHNIKWDGFNYENPIPKNQLKDFNKLPTDFVFVGNSPTIGSYFCTLFIKGILITQFNWKASTFDITSISEKEYNGLLGN